MKGVAARIEGEYRAALAIALQQARFAKADPKKLPKVETILKGGGQAPKPTPRAREGNLGLWAAVLRAHGKRVQREEGSA